MKIRYAGGTHVGMKRPHNEDSFYLAGSENLYIVADGMGGHASGEVASKIAVDTLANFISKTTKDQENTWPYKEDRQLTYDENRLVAGIKLCNRHIFETAKATPAYHGMGTTIVSILCGETGAYLAHVGDSRAYLLRNHTLTQLTEDHSLINDYLKAHKLSKNDLPNFPGKNMIVRALGMKDKVNVDITKLSPKDGDIYLLCSDGLSNMLEENEILKIIDKNKKNLEKACEALIDQANHHGGQDNITAVLIEFTD